MGKGGGSETVTTRLDPQMQQYMDWLRPFASNISRDVMNQEGSFFAGPNRGMREALAGIKGITPGAGFDQFMGQSGQLAGNLGQAFDPASIQGFMDPFRGDVVEGTKGLFDYQRGLASTSAKQQATSAGAFGGARSALLEAQGIGDINRQESQVVPQILSQGYSQALNSALGQYGMQQQQGMAGLQNLLSGTQFGTGLGMQQQNALFQGSELFRQLGERQQQEPIFRGQQALNFANMGIGPYGQTQTATQSGGNPLAGAFGGAMTGFGVGGPIGGLVGGGLGLLGGLF